MHFLVFFKVNKMKKDYFWEEWACWMKRVRVSWQWTMLVWHMVSADGSESDRGRRAQCRVNADKPLDTSIIQLCRQPCLWRKATIAIVGQDKIKKKDKDGEKVSLYANRNEAAEMGVLRMQEKSRKTWGVSRWERAESWTDLGETCFWPKHLWVFCCTHISR